MDLDDITDLRQFVRVYLAEGDLRIDDTIDVLSRHGYEVRVWGDPADERPGIRHAVFAGARHYFFVCRVADRPAQIRCADYAQSVYAAAVDLLNCEARGLDGQRLFDAYAGRLPCAFDLRIMPPSVAREVVTNALCRQRVPNGLITLFRLLSRAECSSIINAAISEVTAGDRVEWLTPSDLTGEEYAPKEFEKPFTEALSRRLLSLGSRSDRLFNSALVPTENLIYTYAELINDEYIPSWWE